jgi:hypothetical protein
VIEIEAKMLESLDRKEDPSVFLALSKKNTCTYEISP